MRRLLLRLFPRLFPRLSLGLSLGLSPVLWLGCARGDTEPLGATAAGSSRAPERAQELRSERGYASSRSRLEARRVGLARERGRRRDQTLGRARELLVATLRDEILPAWDGTPWAFHGTSQAPGQGEIACGYFVTTTLLHLGLQVERAQLAQQASELIAQSLALGHPVRRTSDLPIDAFLDKVRASGAGIYIVGLDNHVGFLIVDGTDAWFHHAAPREVVKREPAREAPYLVASRYRVFARLFDDVLVEKWLRGEPIATVTPKRR
ncbi:MAG TPA: hypothetical protein VNO30_23915 [Kofleriaceae bacterium]|nr:hypothetical protein [Kofleriaceae bacterium]